MTIGIIIVTWNSKTYIDACLDGLRAVGEGNVYVVDNGSSDGSAAYIAESYPEVQLIALPCNTGFAGGNNVGIRRAMADGCDGVLLLNPDTVIDEPFTGACAQAFAADPTLGVVGPVIVHADRPETIQCGGGKINLWTASFPYLEREVPYVRHEEVRRVDYVLGAAMAIRGEVLAKVKGLDEEYFPAYVEEADFCHAARLAGFHCGVIYGTRVRHIGQASAGSRDGEFRRMMRNRFLFAYKFLNPFAFLFAALLIVLRMTQRKAIGR